MTDALEDLKEHWGTAYAIWRNGGTYWFTLKAASAAALRLAIRADYDLKRTSAAPTPGGAPTL